MQKEQNLKNVENFIFDLDHTIWTWNQLVKGAKETIEKLRSKGKKIFFISNNALLTREKLVRRLKDFGIKLEEEELICGSYAAGKTFAKLGIKRTYAIGEEGLIKELENNGIRINLNTNNVLTALDRNFNYWKLSKAITLIKKGAKHWTIGNCPFWQVNHKVMPADDSINEAIKIVTGKDYEVVGKPSDYMKEIVLKEFDLEAHESIMIGDNLKADVVFGNKLGMKTGLVLGGVTSKSDLNGIKGLEVPNFVFYDITRILRRV